MKKIITISVDIDTWTTAKTKIDNVSAYLNECLASLNNRIELDTTESDLLKEIERLKNTIKECAIKQSLAQEVIKNIKDAKVTKEKELLEKEQYMRWKCPVCAHLNFIDPASELCNGSCQLKTKNSPKTVIVDTRKVQ